MAVTREAAVEYLGSRLGGEVFTGETEARQNQALVSAAQQLNRYLAGLAAADSDAAVYEQALWLLGTRAEMQGQGVSSYSISGITESYAVKGRPSEVAPSAWRVTKHGINGTRGGAKVWL